MFINRSQWISTVISLESENIIQNTLTCHQALQGETRKRRARHNS